MFYKLFKNIFSYRKRNELERSASFALNSNTFNSNVSLESISISSSRCESPPSCSTKVTSIIAHIPVQSFIKLEKKNEILDKNNNKNHSKVINKVLQPKHKEEVKKITDEDVNANEKMIQLLSYNNNTNVMPTVKKSTRQNPIKESVLLSERRQEPNTNLLRNLK